MIKQFLFNTISHLCWQKQRFSQLKAVINYNKLVPDDRSYLNYFLLLTEEVQIKIIFQSRKITLSGEFEKDKQNSKNVCLHANY